MLGAEKVPARTIGTMMKKIIAIGALVLGVIAFNQLNKSRVVESPQAVSENEVTQAAEVAPVNQDTGVVVRDKGATFTIHSSNTRPAVVPESQVRR